jgi:hypothetical protein
VRKKEKGYLAVGKSQHPGGSRRQIVARTSGQNPEYRAEREPGLLVRPGVSAECQFATRFACRIASIIRAIRSV